MIFLVYLIVTTIFSIGVTYGLRFYALKRNVIDIPNARSSHSVPTPRGGGVSVVIVFLCCLGLYAFGYEETSPVLVSLFISGSIVALIGFIDDHGHIDAKWRLLIHAIAAFLVAYTVGGLPELNLFGFEIDFGFFGYGISIIAIIWILNLFNFMDGIDGIAGIESVTATFFAGLFVFLIAPSSDFVELQWLLAAASLGFLIVNFPPAKIFMGDAGSGFLGFMLGALALVTSHIDLAMLWVWLVLLGVFIVDATFTVVRRFVRGEKVHEAHRSHAYQFASRLYSSHKKVTLSVLGINVLWLAPIAYLIVSKAINGSLGLIIAYTPLVILAIKFNAGAEEK